MAHKISPQSEPPAQVDAAPVALVEEKHSSKAALIVAVIIVVLIVGLLLLRTLASTAATSYFKNAKQLDQKTLSNALGPDSAQTTDPKEILQQAQRSLDKTKQNVGTLTNIPMGSLVSGKYKQARALEMKVDTLFKISNQFIDETDSVVVFGTAFNTAYTSLNTSATLNSTADKKQVIAEQISRIEQAQLSGDAGKVRSASLKEFKKIISAYDAMISAEKANNAPQLMAAQAQLTEPLRALKNIRFNDFLQISDQLGKTSESIQDQANEIQKLVNNS